MGNSVFFSIDLSYKIENGQRMQASSRSHALRDVFSFLFAGLKSGRGPFCWGLPGCTATATLSPCAHDLCMEVPLRASFASAPSKV